MNERPICHRAEDLVTYLYGEATAAEAQDFATHLETCDACRAEFTVFNQVHDSIVTWRNQALGPARVPEAFAQPAFAPAPLIQHGRRLSALAALREFFTVSPLWLRGATALAGLLLVMLLILVAARSWPRPVEVVSKSNDNKVYTAEDLDKAVQREVRAVLAQQNKKATVDISSRGEKDSTISVKPAAGRSRSKSRGNGLTHEERVQLAADLGLIAARDEELPFVLPEEPNQ